MSERMVIVHTSDVETFQKAVCNSVCSTCKHFSPKYLYEDYSWLDEDGFCERYPPTFVGGDTDEPDAFHQPVVNGAAHCGEWVLNPNIVFPAPPNAGDVL